MAQWVAAASNHAGAVAVAAACRRACRKMPVLAATFLLTVHDSKRWMKQCEALVGTCNTNAFSTS